VTTLDARYVRHPRALYYCDHCSRPLGSYLRLYGMADREPPWTLRLHIGCCPNLSGDPKIAAALTKAEEAIHAET
jgi:hypothetical protein